MSNAVQGCSVYNPAAYKYIRVWYRILHSVYIYLYFIDPFKLKISAIVLIFFIKKHHLIKLLSEPYHPLIKSQSLFSKINSLVSCRAK